MQQIAASQGRHCPPLSAAYRFSNAWREFASVGTAARHGAGRTDHDRRSGGNHAVSPLCVAKSASAPKIKDFRGGRCTLSGRRYRSGTDFAIDFFGDSACRREIAAPSHSGMCIGVTAFYSGRDQQSGDPAGCIPLSCPFRLGNCFGAFCGARRLRSFCTLSGSGARSGPPRKAASCLGSRAPRFPVGMAPVAVFHPDDVKREKARRTPPAYAAPSSAELPVYRESNMSARVAPVNRQIPIAKDLGAGSFDMQTKLLGAEVTITLQIPAEVLDWFQRQANNRKGDVPARQALLEVLFSGYLEGCEEELQAKTHLLNVYAVRHGTIPVEEPGEESKTAK